MSWLFTENICVMMTRTQTDKEKDLTRMTNDKRNLGNNHTKFSKHLRTLHYNLHST